MLGFQTHCRVYFFTWVLRIWTRVLLFTKQATLFTEPSLAPSAYFYKTFKSNHKQAWELIQWIKAKIRGGTLHKTLMWCLFWPKEGRIVTMEVLRTGADKTSLLYIVQSPRDCSVDYYSGILSRTSCQSTGKHLWLWVDAKTLANRRHLNHTLSL